MSAEPSAIRPLPVRVRPFSFETPASYAKRLFEANGIDREVWKHAVFSRARQENSNRARGLESVLEEAGDLRPGHFSLLRAMLPAHADGEACKKCVTGLSARFACMLCTSGVVVEEYAHDGPRTCPRHLRWIGPGTAPDEQFTVDLKLVHADKRYEALRTRGVIDAHRLTEVEECVILWARGELGEDLRADERFASSVAVASASLAFSIAVAKATFAEQYATLSRRIQDAVHGRSSVILTDLVWLLLRERTTTSDPHDFGALFSPLDHAERLQQLRSCAYPRELHFHLTQFVRSRTGRSRLAGLQAAFSEADYRCAQGHLFVASPPRLRRASVHTGSRGCGYCSNRLVLAGFNSLADLRPDIADQWHPSANGDLRPDQVGAGSVTRATWLCPRGHSYEMPVNAKTRRSCPICTNRVVVRDVNALNFTHPEIVADWHPSRNLPVTPDDVVAGSSQKIWWECSNGHDYRLPVFRHVGGRGCQYCARQKAHPTTTSLAVTHPALAKEWHPTLNGPLTPEEVLSGSSKKVWWLCRDGHAFDAAISSRAQGHGCRFCRRYHPTGETSMTATRPDLAAEFHPTKNGSKTADDYVAGTKTLLWWRCSRGHEWQMRGTSRARRKGGCPYCRDLIALPGWNDLATRFPRIASEWHPYKNLPLAPADLTPRSASRVWWQCEDGHEWRMAVSVRINFGRGCPTCRQKRRKKHEGS